MSAITRDVLIDMVTLTGRACAGQWVKFRLKSYGVTADQIIPSGKKRVQIGEDGKATVTLWVNSQSEVDALYECILPTEERFDFILGEGAAPISLAALQQLGSPEGTPQYESIHSYLNANPELFEGPEGPEGPAGRVMSYRIKADETLTIGDGEYLSAPFLDIEAGGELNIEEGGVLDLR